MKEGKLVSALMIAIILLATPPAYARLGNPNPLTPAEQILNYPDWLFETNRSPYTATGDNRTMVVSSGCDVNGDGYADIVIGRKDYDSVTNRNAGKAWLFLGSPTGLSNTPTVTFDSPQDRHSGLFGQMVACAGDVNGDGYQDIMIGMVNYSPDEALPDEGAVFVYYGSFSGPKATPDWMARGNSAWGFMGTIADSAGDVNRDGYDDIIIGTGENTKQAVSHAYIWYGGPDGLGADGVPSNADWVATGPTPGVVGGNYFGYYVSGIGDVNGDSYADIMVTAFLYDGAVENQGAVFVWYGGPGGLGAPGTPENADWMATSGQSNSYFGVSGDGVGDLNGDGYGDLAVGATFGGSQYQGGKVFVWYGSPGGLGENGTSVNVDWSAEGYAGIQLGLVTRPAGDVNHDGFADLLTTAPTFTVYTNGGAQSNAGAWFIWEGSKNGLGANGTPGNADLAGYGDQPGGQLGAYEAGAGDVNKDGLDDIFVAAFNYSHPEIYEGAVFGYYSTIKLYLPLIYSKP